MLINFCNEGLCTIECQRPCSEGRSVLNLQSLDANVRKQGFLVDYFVKPPVEILVKFPCLINLDRIIVKCNIGPQRTSVIRIMAVHEDSTEKTIAKTDAGSDGKALFFSRNTSQFIKDVNNYTYIIFNNAWYLSRVQAVKLILLKTEGSTVPGLGELDIWGFISRYEPHKKYNSIMGLWKQILSSKYKSSEGEGNEPPACFYTTLGFLKEAPQRHKDNFNIPDDFLDPITCQVLTVPMILPSGNVVDITTLEKCNKIDVRRGRRHSDPFTGLPFTETRKPIFASALKVRLDKFLLENSNQQLLKNIPRTSGRKASATTSSNTSDPSYSSSQSNVKDPHRTNEGVLNKPVPYAPYDPSTYSSTICATSRQTNETVSSEPQPIPSYDSLTSVNTRAAAQEGDAIVDNKTPHISSTVSYSSSETSGRKRPRDLDFLLESSLAGLPSFLEKPVKRGKNDCVICGSKEILYKFPCDHLVCRSCLMSLKKCNSKKCVCNFDIDFNAVSRYHPDNLFC